MTSWFQFFFVFFFNFQSFFFHISRTNSKTSKETLNISLFSCIGHSLLTVSLSKIHKQILKNIFFFFQQNR